MSKLVLTVRHLLELRKICKDLRMEAERTGHVDLEYHLRETEKALQEAADNLAVFEHNPESTDYGPV